MNINQLKYFISVARSRSFSIAAEENYITQTAMTQQIKALEDAVGCKLINRSTRPISLTPAGQSFLNDAKLILIRLSDATERANEASSGIGGNLRIGYLKGYERSDLSNYLRNFHRQLPNILLTCYRDTTDKLASSLQNDEYDIIFTWDSTNLKMNPDYNCKLIDTARLMVALYASHPLGQRKALSRIDLKDEALIYMSPSELSENYGDSIFMDLYHEAGYHPNIICRSTDVESILIMVASEEGVSILPDYCVSKITDADGLIFLPLLGDKEVEEIHAIWKKNNDNIALSRFLDSLDQ